MGMQIQTRSVEVRSHTVSLTADEMAHLMIAARAQANLVGAPAARWLRSGADKLQDVLAPLGEASPRAAGTEHRGECVHGHDSSETCDDCKESDDEERSL